MARSRTSSVMRKTGALPMAMAGLLGISASLAHADRILVFTDDFESASLRSEWSSARLDRAGDLSQFAGKMTSELIDLTLLPPPENQSHEGRVTYYMRFDLFTLDGWTGKTEDGNDTRFEVQVGERLMFSHSFSTLMDAEGSYRTPDVGPKPLAMGSAPDSVYRGVLVAFQLDAADQIQVQFRALGLGEHKDYSSVTALLSGTDGTEVSGMSGPGWGIDNVEIWCDYNHNGGGSAGREAELPFVDAAPGAMGGGGEDPFDVSASSAGRPPISTFQIPKPGEVMGGGGSGSGGGGDTVIPPFTPADPSEPTPEKRSEPTPDPESDPAPTDDPPSVPAPGATTLALICLASIAQRRRR